MKEILRTCGVLWNVLAGRREKTAAQNMVVGGELSAENAGDEVDNGLEWPPLLSERNRPQEELYRDDSRERGKRIPGPKLRESGEYLAATDVVYGDDEELGAPGGSRTWGPARRLKRDK